jgi:hypothetical protein
VLKTRPLNPIESEAGSTRSGRVKRCGLSHNAIHFA